MSAHKLRILCIHGYRQNINMFKMKSGAFRKLLKKYCEFVYLEAPFQLPGTEVDERGWWFSSKDSFKATEPSIECHGLDSSLCSVREAFLSSGPFDGLLGFSQGAALVAMVCHLKEAGHRDFDFRFAILIAGFKSNFEGHQIYYQQPISCATLHVMGERDMVISKDMSTELSEIYADCTTHVHDGGHFIPATSADGHIYSMFLNRFADHVPKT